MTGPSEAVAVGASPAAAVERWLAARVPAVRGPLRFDLIAGGRSNLTYAVTDRDGRRWVLRRPPLAGVLPSAHDMGREHRIITALAGSAVPVPAAVGHCADADLIGAPFYVMDFVDGVVARDRDVAEDAIPEPARPVVAESLVATLVALHAVDPAAVGLADLGRGSGYVERQLRRWSGQLEKLHTQDVRLLVEVAGRLAADPPAQTRTVIAHGDYRLGNTIVGDGGRIAAVLDWELCTIGDPLADLAWMLAYWAAPEGAGELPLSMPTAAAGFPPTDQVLARYAALAGADVGEIDFYLAFAYWRLAVILEGVRARAGRGGYGSEGETVTAPAEVVVLLGETAARHASLAGR